jgi:alanine-glyoxylate transaminase/serine-glyoxylate transaminase/serine-pyruvate transaminase
MLRSATNTLIRRAPRAQAASLRAFSASSDKLNYNIVPKDDFGQFKEYSVIFTNRSLNLMSDPFQKVMRDLNDLLKETYNADKVAIIPG